MERDWNGTPIGDGRHLERDEHYGFFRVSPPPTDAELETFYANAYQNPCIPHDPEGRASLVLDLLPRAGRVLDIGCGRGEMLAAFKRQGWQAVGIEPGRQYATMAREQGIEVIEEVLTEDLVDRLGEFDLVLLMHVLEHLPRPEAMLAMVRRLLRRGGILCCEVPNDFNPLQDAAVKVHGLRPWWICLPDHLNYFNLETLAAFVAGHGFEVVRRTSDFPVEIFLLWGDIYIDNPEEGSRMHRKRCRFEQAMRDSGHGRLLDEMYARLGALGVGREAIVCACKV